jgi:hypothetical protein
LSPTWACAGTAINASMTAAAVMVFIASVPRSLPDPTPQLDHRKPRIGTPQPDFSNC